MLKRERYSTESCSSSGSDHVASSCILAAALNRVRSGPPFTESRAGGRDIRASARSSGGPSWVVVEWVQEIQEIVEKVKKAQY